MTYVYDPTLDMWPDLRHGYIVLNPVRIGMDRTTGKVLTAEDQRRLQEEAARQVAS